MAYDAIVGARPSLSDALYTPEALQAHRQMQINNSTQFGRGWESAGLSEEGGALLDAANNAYRKGDNTLGQSLEQQGRDRMAQAQQWAPTVQNFTDIKGLGQAMDWLGGAAGNLRTSVAPAIGGLAGGAIGSLLGPAGAAAGSFIGSSLAGYDTEANEAIGNAMLDPEIRAKRSMQEIKDAGRVKGAINAGLEAIVPAGMGRALFKPAVKALAGQALKTVGKAAGVGAAEEFGTEAAQSLVGQGTENYLKDKPLTDFDYKQAFNEGMAGAVAGGGMGAVGGGAQALKANLGAGVDKVADVASNPVAEAAYALGKKDGDTPLEEVLSKKLDPEAAAMATILNPKSSEDQRAKAAEEYASSINARPDATDAEREMAAKMTGRWSNYADALTIDHHDKKNAQSLQTINDEADKLVGKQSRMGMTEEGDTASQLAKLWLDTDGKATKVFKNAVPEDAHLTATKLMGWIASGFGAEHTDDGKPFVMKSLVDELGDHAVPMVHSMFKLAKAQGIYRGTDADMNSVLAQMKERHDTLTTDANAIDKLLTPLAHAHWSDNKTNVVMQLLRKKQGDVSASELKALQESFGPNTEKLLAHFTPASQEKRDEAAGARKKTSSPLAAGMEEEGGRTVVSNKLGDETLGAEAEQHNTGMGEMSVQRNAPVFEGAGDKPLNTKYDDRKRELGEKLQHYAENQHLGKDVREVGAWDAVKEKHADDPMALYKAEDDLIKTHGKDVGVGKGATEAEARQHMLTQINKQFRYVRVQDKDVAAKQDKPSALHVEDIETLREKPKGEYSKNVTPEHGMLYLGRKATVDKETGEIQGKDEWFQTSAHKLLGHAWKALGKEGEVSDAEGARAHYENVLQAVSALMASDPSFTGKIGVRNAAGVGVKTVTELPGNFKLSKSATVADALKQIKKESTKQDGPTHQEKVRALQRVLLENSSDELGYLDAHIRHALDDGSTSVVDKVYNEVNGGKWNDHDIVGDVVGEDGKQEAVKVLSKREDPAGDDPIHRTPDGARAGSEGYGYEGNSRGGKEGSGVESRSQADKTKGDKHATQRPVDKAAQWAFDAIRKGMPSFAAALKKMSEVQLELLQQGLKQLSSMSIKGVQDNWASMSTSEAKRILFYATNAVLHLKNRTELVKGDSNGRTERGGSAESIGQSDAVRRSEGEGGVPSSDRSRGSARTELDAEQLDNAIVNEDYSKLGTVAKLQQFAKHVADRAREVSLKDERGEDITKREEAIWAIGGDLVSDARRYLKNPGTFSGTDFDSFFDGIEHTDADVQKFVKTLAGTKQNAMSADIHRDLGKEGFGATHDSPIRHEGKFNWRAHIGKGEGNASFGAGTYLSTANGVHRMYKKQFTADLPNTRYFTWGDDVFEYDPDIGDILKNGKPAEAGTGEYEVAHAMLAYGLNPKEALEQAKNQAYDILDRSGSEIADHVDLSEPAVPNSALSYLLNALRERKHIDEDKVHTTLKPFLSVERWNKMLDRAKQRAAALESINVAELKTPLNAVSPTYHVTVNAQQDELLDWDAPLSEQSAKVQKAAEEVNKLTWNITDDLTGAQLYKRLTTDLGSQSEASDYLQSLGIVGHVYNAAGGKEVQHRNYVIYDDSRIETNYVSFNRQQGVGKRASKEDVAAARQHIIDTLGDSVKLAFKKTLGGVSGEWTPGHTKNSIEIALNSDVLGTAYHESLHEFFNMLTKRGATATQELLTRVATNNLVTRQLEQLLYKHPEALKQMRSSPEEALAYMYQFWRAGAIKLGPQAEGFFGKVVNFFKNVLSLVSKEVRDQQHAEVILQAFASGAVADNTSRDAVIAALNEKTELHNKALDNAGTLAKRFSEHALGKLTMTAQGMMEATGDPYMKKLADMFHQKAGASMVKGAGWRGAYFDAVGQVNDKYQNKLANILDGMDAKDIDIVREVLSGATQTPDIQRIKDAVKAMKALNDEMMDYIDERNISRLDEQGHWVKVERRKDFGMPQVWDTAAIQKNPAAFKADLLATHPDALSSIAKQANEEAKLAEPKNLAAKAGKEQGVEVTPEMVADAIIQRVVMSGGKVDIQETTSDLGITPLAASVNRRSLNWIDAAVFDKYKQKDLYNIYSTYIANMTKRGEYTVRFGHGGEVIRDLFDRAFLNSLGGEHLVERADAELGKAVEDWRKQKAAAMSQGGKYDAPYPTLRSVGVTLHKEAVGKEQFTEDALRASKATEQSAKAVQAMEGTLGMDITSAMRNVNSWVMTYENLRLLIPSLFTSMSDVMGLTLNGGTMNDAWKAFVRGMKEVKHGIVNDTKVNDADSQRAETWGTVDAMTLNDTLGQGYGSMYMSGKAKAISDKFFRKIGMESWNRSMRISATGVAEDMIMRWADGKIDMNNASEKARFERLYGEGAKLQDIKLDSNGKLDVHDVKNQAAVMRFVNDAVLRPNAAMRPIWSSDPHYAMFFHLKSFTYAMHKTWLEAALNEARMGNYRPAMVLLSVYMPMGIAAGAMKELLIPGDDPPWEKAGLGGFLSYGMSKAGLGGVPQMALGAYDSAFTDLLGPAASQVRHAVMDNPVKTGLAALPGGGILQRYGPKEAA